MQIILRDRETLSEPMVTRTQTVDMQEMTGFVWSLVIHAVAGTSPNLDVQFETSDNLEDWTNVGTNISSGSAGMSTQDVRISTGDNMLRYVRAAMSVTGTDPVVNFTIAMNTFVAT